MLFIPYINTCMRIRRKYRDSSTYALFEDGAHRDDSTGSTGHIVASHIIVIASEKETL